MSIINSIALGMEVNFTQDVEMVSDGAEVLFLSSYTCQKC